MAQPISRKVRAQRKRELQNLLKENNNNVLKVAKKLKMTPQGVYAKMKAYGIEIRRLLKGEPKDKRKKKAWMVGLLRRHKTPAGVARYLKVHENTIRNRISSYGIKYRPERPHKDKGEPQNLNRRRNWMANLLETKGSVIKVAKYLGISSSAVYERMRRYGLAYV